MSLLADRTRAFDSSGIRKVFDLAAQDEGPDQSLDRPARFRRARAGQGSLHRGDRRRARTPTPSRRASPVLRDKLQAADRRRVTATPTAKCSSPAAPAAGWCWPCGRWSIPATKCIDLRSLLRDVPVAHDSWPAACRSSSTPIPTSASTWTRSRAAITPRTKLILLNSPANPTGVVASEDEIRGLAELAAERNVAARLSDEIYQRFCYDAPFASPAKYNDARWSSTASARATA